MGHYSQRNPIKLLLKSPMLDGFSTQTKSMGSLHNPSSTGDFSGFRWPMGPNGWPVFRGGSNSAAS